MTKPNISHERLLEILHYDPETGVFTRLVSHRTDRIGKNAGHQKASGYVTVTFNGEYCLAHRLAFFYQTGAWPEGMVDHINRNPADNSWANLREASRSVNGHNGKCYKSSSTGVRGVFPYQNKSGTVWKAQYHDNGQHIHLGTFYSFDAAVRVRKRAEIKYGYISLPA